MTLGTPMYEYRLGGPDAWGKFESLILREVFFKTQQYDDISGLDKIFLCGRRGSGKSAIARMLAEDKRWKYAQSIQGERSEYGAFMDIVQSLGALKDNGVKIDIRRAISRLWSWTLRVTAMRILVNLALDNGEHKDNDIKQMEVFLDSLPHPIHSESTIGHLLSVMFGRAIDMVNEGTFDHYLVELNNSKEFTFALQALERKTKRERLLLVLDTLESNHVFEKYVVEGFQGILEAIVAFLADTRVHGVSLKYFLPAEVYEDVFSGFPGKVQPQVVFMRWQAADIIALLAGRFLHVLKKNKSIPLGDAEKLSTIVKNAYDRQDGGQLREEFWYSEKFLPRKIHNTVGGEEDCFAYLLRHSFRRPRDIITGSMQQIVYYSVINKEFPYISEASVIAGVHSDTALQQMLADALSPYEGKIPISMISGARSAFFGRQVILNGSQLKQFSKELYNLHPLKNLDHEVFIDMLLRCGVIGLVKETVVSETKPQLYCTGQFEYMMQGNLPLTERLVYCIHPVMADLFKMDAPKGRGVVYPMPEEDTWLEKKASII
jgi:hypothetical protein